MSNMCFIRLFCMSHFGFEISAKRCNFALQRINFLLLKLKQLLLICTEIYDSCHITHRGSYYHLHQILLRHLNEYNAVWECNSSELH